MVCYMHIRAVCERKGWLAEASTGIVTLGLLKLKLGAGYGIVARKCIDFHFGTFRNIQGS